MGFFHAIFHSREANRISPQIYWARLRINMSVVLEKMKGRARSRARLAGGIKNVNSSGKGIASVLHSQGNPVEPSHVAMMAEMMAKLESLFRPWHGDGCPGIPCLLLTGQTAWLDLPHLCRG